MLSPSERYIPTCYSPVRHSRIAASVRLACVRPAASVRSEPGSNSQVDFRTVQGHPEQSSSKAKITRLLARCASWLRTSLIWPAPPAHPFLASSLCQRAENLSVPVGAVAFASSPPRQRGGRFILNRRPGVNFFFSVRFVFFPKQTAEKVEPPLFLQNNVAVASPGGRGSTGDPQPRQTLF